MTSTWTFVVSLPSPTITPTGWKTVNIGDYGRIDANGVGQADGFRDGKLDLLLRNPSTKDIAFWIMKGANGDQFGGGYGLVDLSNQR